MSMPGPLTCVQVARMLGLHEAAGQPKRAIQVLQYLLFQLADYSSHSQLEG